MSWSPRRLPAGFTLLELLISIVIIVILASLMTPSLFRGKEYARRVVCSQGLHQCSIAVNLYALDSRGYFPWHYETDFKQLSDAAGEFNTGLGLLYPAYVDNAKIFFCPSEREYTIESYFPAGTTYYGTYDFYGSEPSGGELLRHRDSPSSGKALAADVEVSWGTSYLGLVNRLNKTHRGGGHNVLHIGGDVNFYSTELTGDTYGEFWGGAGAWPDWTVIDAD